MKHQIWPRKPSDHSHRLGQTQLIHNILLYQGRGRCSKRSGNRSAHFLAHHSKIQIIRTKVMPPLRNTMRLIHSKQRDRRVFKRGAKTRIRQTLWRDIYKLHLATDQLLDPFGLLIL